jgi:Transposase and inactivated derivatives
MLNSSNAYPILGCCMGNQGPKPKFNNMACPNEKCGIYGQTGKGNIIGNGTYKTKSGKVRKYICRCCGSVFNDRTNTAFFDLRTKDEKVLIALKMIIKGMSLRSVAEILGVKLDTVRRWLAKAAKHSDEVNCVLLKDLNVSKVELDELWTFVKKKTVPRMEEYEDDGTWIWLSFAPEYRMVIAHSIGERKQYVADEIVNKTSERIGSKPLFVTDGLKFYTKALLKTFNIVVEFSGTGKRGRPRKPKQNPDHGLRYAQVIKHRRHGRLRKVEKE